MIITLLAIMITAVTSPSSAEAVQAGEIASLKKSSAYVEQYVRVYFSDIPEMAEVAQCESRFRQYDEDGNTLRGEENRRDVGVMQINEQYHLHDALEMGIDLYTLEGNLEYARHLYETMGLKPWKYSKKCWGTQTLALAR
ncbi:MAG: hypothetical protein OQJ98_02205 [Candidatus Pacebacteria bacterium]|nr:hypothetical protein [Candidatus Paceibacterota bacterium]